MGEVQTMRRAMRAPQTARLTIETMLMETRKPNIELHGPAATHDMPCPVFFLEQPAVYDITDSVFRPSWAAQAKGWHLVHANTWWRRLLLRIAFS